MDPLDTQMCSYCINITENGDIWYDTTRQKEQQKLGRMGCRKFKDIDKSFTKCHLCYLARIALKTEDGLLPELNTMIYYSRVLFARYHARSAISTPNISFQGLQDEIPQFHYTYRLRVSTCLGYSVKHTDNLDYIRQFQSRPGHDFFCSPLPQGGEISLLCEKAGHEYFANGRQMGAQLDFELAKNWINTCGSHQKQDEYSSIRKTPNRVINVRSRKIEWARPECVYAALSYCWGPPETQKVRLNRDTEIGLMCDGLDMQRFEIPKTISDAIAVCEKLGIEYLWVDALCRPEGPDEKYQAERKREDISDVYKNSHLTIICEGENSQCGLPYVNSGQRQDSVHIGSLFLAVSKLTIDEAMHGSGWMRRLWTLDEYVQSQRCLIFTRSQVFFKCQHEDRIFCEDTHLEISESDSMAITDVDLATIDPFWAQDSNGFQRYALNVKEYTSRQVTNPADWSRGFKSSKRAMEAEFGQEYIHDLPATYFAQALCFEIFDSERRSTASFPSWSWQGWDVSGSKSGQIYFCSSRGFCDQWVTFYHAKESPSTNTFKFQPVEATQKFRLFNSPELFFKDNSGSEILDQLSLEEKAGILAFSTVTIELCVSVKQHGYWNLALPGSENSPIAQASLNTRESCQVGSLVRCALIGLCQDDDDTEQVYFIVIGNVRGLIFCRVGSCTVKYDDIDQFKNRWKLEVIYLV